MGQLKFCHVSFIPSANKRRLFYKGYKSVGAQGQTVLGTPTVLNLFSLFDDVGVRLVTDRASTDNGFASQSGDALLPGGRHCPTPTVQSQKVHSLPSPKGENTFFSYARPCDARATCLIMGSSKTVRTEFFHWNKQIIAEKLLLKFSTTYIGGSKSVR